MNRLERLTAILLLLQDRASTSDEIARRFEVSRRTILRDVQALSEMGVPIVAREGAGGGYSLPADYALAPLPLTAREAFLLLLALGSLSRLSDVPYAAERTSLLAKLRAALPKHGLRDVEGLLAAVSVDMPQRDERSPFLDDLVAAAHARRWVQASYQSAERLSSQRLLPLQLYLREGFWYCRAFSYEHGEERTYRADRFRAVLPADDPLEGQPVPTPRPYAAPDDPEVHAVFTARGVLYAESDPHFGREIRRRPDGSGELLWRCPPGELDWCARFFAGLGPDVSVQGPPELRRRLYGLGEQLVEQYRER
jgi:predicted DNA-binding transcriptional regulator YafY